MRLQRYSFEVVWGPAYSQKIIICNGKYKSLNRLFNFVTCRYGDKTPRSFFGRLFGVLWILLGVIVITMFTATVTSALTHSSSPEFTTALVGQKVSNDIKLTISVEMLKYSFEAI